MQRLEPDRAAWLLAFDIAELAVLLFFTGGLQNPFSLLLMGPVLLSATGLPPRMTLLLGGFAITCATVLIFVYYPLPWDNEPLDLPAHYVMGLWLSLLLAISFVGLHAWQITEEARQLANALAATELVLEREQHLSQLDGLAAAAAHELGTPLSTITVVARELERAMKPGSEHADDVRLLNEQAQRCRSILGKLTELSPAGAPFDRMKLSLLIEEVVAPHRNFGIAINVALAPEQRRQSRSADAIRPSSTGSAIFWRTPSTSRASASTSRRPGAARRSRSPSPTTGRALHRRSWIASASPTSRAAAMPRPAADDEPAASRLTNTKRAGSVSASSSPRHCWSARVRRSTSGTGYFPNAAPSCACSGTAPSSNRRSSSPHDENLICREDIRDCTLKVNRGNRLWFAAAGS